MTENHPGLHLMHDALDIALERKQREGELAVPDILAALELLPLEERHLIGTCIRGTVEGALVRQQGMHEFAVERGVQQFYEERDSISHRIGNFLRRAVGTQPKAATLKVPSAIPTLTDEIRWLVDNIDESSPSECMLLSEFFSKLDLFDRARDWYEKGLIATRELAEANPDTPIAIIE